MTKAELHRRRSAAARKAWATRNARGAIDLTPGSDAHRIVIRLLLAGVCSCALGRATGQSPRAIAALRAHATMGTYKG